jgi:hypothetical protein
MRSLLAVSAASLALGVTHPGELITSSQAAHAMTAQIHRQTTARLRGGYHGQTSCSGGGGSELAFNPTTELPRWHCTMELGGARFPRPCRAVANVFATANPHHVRIRWLAMSRYCRVQ